MPKIEIRFGNSIAREFEDFIANKAIEWDCSFDLAYTHSFKNLLANTLLKKNKDGETYYDLAFLIASEKHVIPPKVKFAVYEHNAFKLPKFVLDKDYLIEKINRKKLPLSDQMLNDFGEFFEENFEFEYVGFVRL